MNDLVVNNKVVYSAKPKTNLHKQLVSALDKIGGPSPFGIGAAILSYLPAYIALKFFKKDKAALKALGISGALGLATGLSMTPFTKREGYSYGENLLGKPIDPLRVKLDQMYLERPERITKTGYRTKYASDISIKEAADFFANLPNTDKLTLHDLVESTPGFTPPQRDFLHNGIYNAPSNKPNVMDLANGFTGTVNAVTGGLLPMTTRAIEGALIGGAFSSVMGVQPGTRKFVTGAAAVADSLFGNQLFNTIPKV